MNAPSDIQKFENVAFVLKTIAHPMRIGIIELLTKSSKLSVTEICTALGSEQSLTSHHLSNMKFKGILSSERKGKNIYYSLKLLEVIKIINCMENCDMSQFS